MMTDLRFAVIGPGYWGSKIVRNLEALSHTRVAIVADLDDSICTRKQPRAHGGVGLKVGIRRDSA
jgi:hypothetical protein